MATPPGAKWRASRARGVRRLGLFALGVSAGMAACSHDWAALEVLAGTSSSSGEPFDGGPDAPCSTVGGDICKVIPKVPLNADGSPDFCMVPVTTIDATTAALVVHVDGGPSIEETTQVHVGWSTLGLHFHFAVHDLTFRPPAAAAPIWEGDCVEVFVKGDTAVTGIYDGMMNDTGAVHVIIAPSDGTMPRRATSFWPQPDGSLHEAPLDGKAYSTAVTPDGYVVDLLVRWELLRPPGMPPPAAPASGQTIAVDIAIDTASPASNGRIAQLVYNRTYVGTPLPVCSDPLPNCDDRTWCNSTLQ